MEKRVGSGGSRLGKHKATEDKRTMLDRFWCLEGLGGRGQVPFAFGAVATITLSV